MKLKTATMTGLVLVGIVIGLLLPTAVQQVQAQSGKRLQMTTVPNEKMESGKWTFIKDTKSGGCWFAFAGAMNGASMLAAAPKEACD